MFLMMITLTGPVLTQNVLDIFEIIQLLNNGLQ